MKQKTVLNVSTQNPSSNLLLSQMKRKIIIISSALGIILILSVWLLFFKKTNSTEITVKPTRGTFKVTVTTTGELQAKNSIDIVGPPQVRSVGIWQMQISKLVDEGTVVKAGEFVAELDKAEIMNKINEKNLSIQKLESQYLQTKLDSTLNLSKARDELENLKFGMEEKQLIMEQSKFEAPAIIRQAEISYEREKRNLEQAQKNYQTKVKQAIASINVVGADLSKDKQSLERLMEVLNGFTILAPADGMVIYAREWSGKRITVGSQIGAWDPVVATLPDLTSMESMTFVNEVDIQKITTGQFVNISLDANPNKKLTGKVVKVANIGEQRKNSDSKVFEVHIQVNEKDTTLLPAMTTSNEIVISTIKNSLFVPLECIHTEVYKKENIKFVYKKNNGKAIKQQIKVGTMNENEAIILDGVKLTDLLLLSIPENSKEMKINFLKKSK